MVKSAAVEQSTVLCVQRIGECFAPVRHVVADHTLTRGQPAANDQVAVRLQDAGQGLHCLTGATIALPENIALTLRIAHEKIPAFPEKHRSAADTTDFAASIIV